MKKILLTLVLFVVVLVPALSQAQASPEAQGILANIYNANFGAAQQKIDQFIASKPQDPTGYILRGIYREWLQLIQNKNKSLNSTIMADYQTAQGLAETALANNPSSIQAKTQLGNALMYLAKKQLDLGQKMKAGNTLKKSKELMLEVLATDPGNAEAYFAVGMFNYFAENVPGAFKWLAALMGFKGNRQMGLDYITRAAGSASLFKYDAGFLLVYIYARKENAFSSAFPYAKALNTQFPNNWYFLFLHAEMLYRVGQAEASRAAFAQLDAYCTKNQGHCDEQTQFLRNLFVAWGYVDAKDYTAAKPYVVEAKRLIKSAGTSDRVKRIEGWLKLVGEK